ncbi:NAD(P)-dependent dehydrogenase, short-chain alcohol dehydrogenase family [Brevibacterium sandarakinum]|uniref:NAD(P)-dependent dehydrogenase, short-chain alcohol dehydrogenase family n=1 Tax=Brevibacterium sandarakinum TaxID=629680 RepID=A0A1H1XBC1_BRESA|nr:SDR family oxidoreductase [Brevibacterium sandarakinum]SDT06331.1 NAD(P)-dependent dehydrogenase, short-chain alcohol dehydrogenase family [Brevibacterium sandarakinum]
MARFTDKRILITGGTNGIGLAGVRRVSGEGGLVMTTGSNPERIDSLRQELPDAQVWRNDASDADTGEDLARQLGEPGGGLDGLWLNAGYADIAPVEEVTAEFFDRMMAVNVRAAFLQLAALSPHLNDRASVVITSSTGSVEGSPVATVYAATKGAIESAARGWATALAPRNIRVNVLVPGNVDTDFRRFMDADTREAFNRNVISRVPLGRAGISEEAAAVALFLLSDDAAYVNGSRYFVDGGLSKR